MQSKKIQMKNKHPSFGRTKLAKRAVHMRGKWKAVELDPSLFSEEGMGGLVCFEELTDYRLVDSAKAAAKVAKAQKKKAKKRKASEGEEGEGELIEVGEGELIEEGSEGGDDTTETSERPAKKKRKKRKKKKNKVSGEESTKTENISVDGEVKKEETEQPPEVVADKEGGEETKQDQGPEVVADKEGGKETKPNQGPEVVADKEAGKEEASEESKSKDSAIGSEMDDQLQSNITKEGDKKKRKKKRKKKGQARQETVPELDQKSQADGVAAQAVKQSSQDKIAKLPKKRAKNWTDTGLSGSADQNADMRAWRNLFVPAPVLQALSSLGFGSPTPIQALALPSAIRDRMDIVGAAETGSGKTLSFGIPMIHTILEWKKGSEEQDEVGDQTEATARVESLYLPDEAEEMSAEADPSVEIDVSTPAETSQMAGDSGDTNLEISADPTTQQDQECAMEAGQEEDGGVSDDDRIDSDEDDVSGDENLSEEEGEDERFGCVKVIEDVEFDFDTTTAADAVEKSTSSQNQPLLGLVLTPTRELAVQVKHHIDAVAKFTGIKTAIVVGGMSQQKQRRMLKRRPEIVIATPGRLWELIKERNPHLQNLRQLRCLVIDEADRMVERGHFAELENLLEMLNTDQFNPKRQTFVFSATLTMAHSLPTRFLQKKKKKVDNRSKLEMLMEKVGMKAKPKVIDLTRKEATVETLTETRIHCEKDEKDFYLYYFLLQYPGRTMVFANSIECIKRLNSLLVILDRTPLPLHANMHQKHRLKNLERFAERESCVLLTTDVAARGLDIPNVEHVIHYQVPRTSETYVHRSGRTARATKEGLSLLLIGPDDMLNFKKIYRTLGKDEDLPMFPVQIKCMAAIKERVNLARGIEKIEFHNSREKHHNSWFKQAAEALEVDLDDDVLLGQGKDEDDERCQQKMVKGMKKHLKHLLSQPVFKNDIKTRYPTQMGKLSLPRMPLAGMETALTSVSIQRKKNQKHNKKQQQ